MYTTTIELKWNNQPRHLKVKHDKNFIIESVVDTDSGWTLDGLTHGDECEIEEAIEEKWNRENY